MKKRIFAVLLAVTMVMGMLPVIAGAEAAVPVIKKVNMTLDGILGINFKVDAQGGDMAACSIRVTVGDDAESQLISQYKMDGALYVYTAKLPAHRIPEAIKVELIFGGAVVQTKTDWTVASYLNDLVTYNPGHTELADLKAALLDYGAYAAYYADPTGTVPNSSAVEALTRDAFAAYRYTAVKKNSALGASAALFIDDACDLQVKFHSDTWGTHSLLIDGNPVTVGEADGKMVYALSQLLPQNWSRLYSVKVLDDQGAAVYEIRYGVFSYAYLALGSAQEVQAGLNGLLKAMYLYQAAAVAYSEASDQVIENGPIDEEDGPVIEF